MSSGRERKKACPRSENSVRSTEFCGTIRGSSFDGGRSPVMEARWIVAPACPDGVGEISWPEICGLPCIVELLKRKGFTYADEVNAFLQPRLRSLDDPFLLPNMSAAVARILE